jgi:quinohemoprotein ethanol dehydrogenase
MPHSPPPSAAVPLDDPAFAIDAAKLEAGKKTYTGSCVSCHGGGVVSGGSAPDLRASSVALTREGLKAVVVDGERVPKGMPRFQEFGDAELDGLMHYIRSRARETMRPIEGG